MSLALRMMQTGGPTKQLGQRIAEPVYDLLMATAAENNVRARTLLEYAIVKAFGTEEGRRQWHGK